MNINRLERGFTLLEISIALLLIGLLIGGGLTINSALRQLDKSTQTQAQMLEIKMALMTYLKVNKFLPCPDTDGDGVENRDMSAGVSVCHSRQGRLPYQTLSTVEADAWGNPFYYRVNPRSEQAARVNDICETASVFGVSGARTKPNSAALCADNGVFYCTKCGNVCPSFCDFNADPRTQDAPPYFSLHTPPKGSENADGYKNMLVKDENGVEIENGLVAVVVSYGSNGFQTWLSCSDATLVNTPERNNCDNDVGGEFQIDNSLVLDDYLTWITVHDVKQAMIEIKGF